MEFAPERALQQIQVLWNTWPSWAQLAMVLIGGLFALYLLTVLICHVQKDPCVGAGK